MKLKLLVIVASLFVVAFLVSGCVTTRSYVPEHPSDRAPSSNNQQDSASKNLQTGDDDFYLDKGMKVENRLMLYSF